MKVVLAKVEHVISLTLGMRSWRYIRLASFSNILALNRLAAFGKSSEEVHSAEGGSGLSDALHALAESKRGEGRCRSFLMTIFPEPGCSNEQKHAAEHEFHLSLPRK
jgi:hypothetical protein